MASSQTSNYKLNQWAASDKFLRTEFNSDNSKIDAALKALASKDTALDGAKCGVTTGVYTGDGATSRTITLGFRPSVVLLMTENGITRSGNISYGGLAMADHPMTVNNCTMIEATQTGFILRRGGLVNGDYYAADPNSSNAAYRYMVLH